MKNKILFLAVACLVLINIFQYVNSSKVLKDQEGRIDATKNLLKTSRDSVAKLLEENQFSLDLNEDAKEYYAEQDWKSIKAKVVEDLMNTNTEKGPHRLISYEATHSDKFLINSIKVLNHRWIIANYSDGKGWGEVLIKYFHNQDKPTDFETVDVLFYTHTLTRSGE